MFGPRYPFFVARHGPALHPALTPETGPRFGGSNLEQSRRKRPAVDASRFCAARRTNYSLVIVVSLCAMCVLAGASTLAGLIALLRYVAQLLQEAGNPRAADRSAVRRMLECSLRRILR